MSPQDSLRPTHACHECGYDMRSLFQAGIRRCPECGVMVPQWPILSVEPRSALWYTAAGILVLAPIVLLGAARVFAPLVGHSWDGLLREPIQLLLIALTFIYEYALISAISHAHRLPRAGFGAALPALLAVLLMAIVGSIMIA